MKLTLYYFGKRNELTAAEDDLVRKINFRCSLEVLCLPQAGITDPEICKIREGDALLKKISPTDYLIALDEHGAVYTSIQFAAQLKKDFIARTHLTFVVGGAYGLSEAVLRRADATLSLSSMVWTRNLARHMTLEQLYRALEIDGGSNFHKG